MGRRGPKPKGKVKIKWSANFAYAIGLLVTDGNVSKDGRRITFTSKDVQQIRNFMRALSIKVFIGETKSGYDGNKTPRVQFRDVLFGRFLISIGITPNKTKTITAVKIPNRYFFDFLRGHFDGDGSSYSYWDKRWKSSFMFYTSFSSASDIHICWLQKEIRKQLGVVGYITKDKRGSTYQLKYAKSDSVKILRKIYLRKEDLHLSRKRLKIEKMLSIVGERL